MKYTNEENIPLAFAVLLATDNYDKSYENIYLNEIKECFKCD